MTLIDTDNIPAPGKADAALPGHDQAVSPHVQVLVDRCAGCQECLVRCPTAALSLDPVTWTVVADDAACVGCRQCVRTCPFSAIVVEGPQLVASRVTIAVHHPDRLAHDHSETRVGIATWAEALAEANRCLDCPDPTCVRGCPAHNDIPGFIREIRAGNLDKAHEVLRRTSVLPDVCSRVCDQALQCEGSCTWSLGNGAPVAIGALERFVSDNAPVPPIQPSARAAGTEVAIVGSGPAGIAAASELASAGAKVTVYERDREAGGLLRWGIPDFTLPDAVARRPWETLQAAGVELELEHRIEASDIDELTARFDAVVIAAGASMPLRLPVPGGDLEGVWDATRFLTEAHDALASGKDLEVLRRGATLERDSEEGDERGAGRSGPAPTVLVLGAGNTAMDVARSARRFGAKAICVDWMDRQFAPVRPDELEEAATEGVEVRFSTTVQKLEGAGGHVTYAHLARTSQKNAGELPKVLSASTFIEPVDLVVMAMGYRIAPEVAEVAGAVPVAKAVADIPDRRWLGSGILANPSPDFARHQPVGRLALGRDHVRVIAGLPRRERVWVAGDSLVGPSTVVEAMAQGKRAAESIIHHAPRRPGRPRSATRTRVLVAVESRGGKTASVAAELAQQLATRAADVKILPMKDVSAAQLAWADSLVVATWVEGLVIAKVGPARATIEWMESLPAIGGMPVALLCTYAVSPGRTLRIMRETLERRGGKVLAEVAISRRLPEPRRAEALGAAASALTPTPPRHG